MLNVATMTCDEVNEELWKRRRELLKWPDDEQPLLQEYVGVVPDYCHYWAACGPLLEECVRIRRGELTLRYEEGIKLWSLGTRSAQTWCPEECSRGLGIYGRESSEAIARTRLAMYGDAS